MKFKKACTTCSSQRSFLCISRAEHGMVDTVKCCKICQFVLGISCLPACCGEVDIKLDRKDYLVSVSQTTKCCSVLRPCLRRWRARHFRDLCGHMGGRVDSDEPVSLALLPGLLRHGHYQASLEERVGCQRQRGTVDDPPRRFQGTLSIFQISCFLECCT